MYFTCSSLLVSWCFKPSQPQRSTSGLKTNLGLSPSYSWNKFLNVLRIRRVVGRISGIASMVLYLPQKHPQSLLIWERYLNLNPKWYIFSQPSSSTPNDLVHYGCPLHHSEIIRMRNATLSTFLRGLTFTWWRCCGLCFWHQPARLARSFLFCSCVCFCLYGPFNCI